MFSRLAVALACLALASTSVTAQDYGNHLGTRPGEEMVYSSSGVPIYTHALDPTVHRWYVPPTMFAELRRSQWEYTNRARDRYKRYIDRSLEGDYFYDVYGNLTTKGWLVYDWRQSQPASLWELADRSGGWPL